MIVHEVLRFSNSCDPQFFIPMCDSHLIINPIGSMYAIYGDIYHQYTPNVSIYTIHGSYANYSI